MIRPSNVRNPFGRRLAVEAPLELFSGFRRERLLRVTDPRSALVAASPRCAV